MLESPVSTEQACAYRTDFGALDMGDHTHQPVRVKGCDIVMHEQQMLA